MRIEDWASGEFGVTLWENKYRHGDETFDEFLDRVSNNTPEVRKLIEEKKFLFAGRILSSRGLPAKTGVRATYSNCYVMPPVEDDIEGIFESAKYLARTFSYGGGCGLDITKLRPADAPVNNGAKTTSGAVSFMPLYSLTTELIGQNGRRGALMLSMDSNHPDILDFIESKQKLDAITKANISVKVNDKLMHCLDANAPYELKYHSEDYSFSKLVDPYDIWAAISNNAWENAEPGILYWDTIKRNNFLYDYIKSGEFEYAGVNPCAEEPLPAGGSCLLGSINLAQYVLDEVPYAKFNYYDFKNDVTTAIKALNDVLMEGLPLHPFEFQRKAVNDWRQIGLGVMGIGDLLIKLGMRYDSDEAISFIGDVFQCMMDTAVIASAHIANRNEVFPKYDKERIKSSVMYQRLSQPAKNAIKAYGLANSQLLSIAPTGSISNMIGVTGGIEPIFATSYKRKTESLHKGEAVYYNMIPDCLKELTGASDNMTDKEIAEWEEALPEYVVTAHDINPFKRIDMQAAAQKYVDASISSTVNLKAETSVDTVSALYKYAWAQGCKGLTIYRDACAREGILTVNKTNTDKESTTMPTEWATATAVDVPGGGENFIPLSTAVKEYKVESNYLEGMTDRTCNMGNCRRLNTGCGTLWVNSFFDRESGEINDLFLDKGSKGGCNAFMVGLSRMISLCIREGNIPLDRIVDQLTSVPDCNSFTRQRAKGASLSPGTSCPAAIGRALQVMEKQNARDRYLIELGQHYEDVDEEEQSTTVIYAADKIDVKVHGKTMPITSSQIGQIAVGPTEAHMMSIKNLCPDCGNELEFSGGCNSCKECGYSKCD